MPVLDDDGDWAGACRSGGGGGGGVFDDDSGRQRCSCLPFCFWGASSSKPAGAPAKRRRRRRRRRFRLRLRLSWLAWPWFFRKGGGKQKGGDGDDNKGIRKRRGRRLLLLLTASLQPNKALASVVSGDSALLPAAKVSSFGDAKKQSNRRKPRPAADDDGSSSGSRQPQASTSAAAASTRWSWSSTAPAAASRTETSQPSPRPTDGRMIWRAPSRRHSLLHCRFDSSGTERPCGAGGLLTAATTLGVIVLFGRVTAVVFLCSCLYGARFVRARLGGGAGASAKATIISGVAGGGSGSRRFGDPAAGVVVSGETEVVVKEADQPCAAEEYCKKKKVVMAGLLDRPGKTASSRFGR